MQTGSIFIKIVDDQGAAVPGATVTLTSPVLPRPLVGVTDSAGVHRFTALTVGTYAAKTALAGIPDGQSRRHRHRAEPDGVD